MNRVFVKEGLRRFFNFHGLAWRMGFLFLTGIMIILLISFCYVLIYSYRILLNEAQLTAGEKASLTSSRIENVIRPIEEVTNILSRSILYEPENFKEIHRITRDYVVENPVVFGSIIAFEPYLYRKGKKYHAEYIYQNHDTLRDLSIERNDYDYFSYEWYSRPKNQAKSGWSEPYFDKGAGNILMCTYSAPFYRKYNEKRQFAGVLTMDISLVSLDCIVSSVHIYKSGYAVMISRNGVVIASPNRQYVNRNLMDVVIERQRRIRESDTDGSIATMGSIISKARNGESGFLKLPRLANTNKPVWISYKPVSSTGWSLLIIFPEDELVSDMNSFLQKLFVVIFLSILATLIVTIFVVRRFTRPITRLAFAARIIGQGSFNAILPVYRSNDEVSLLANSFSLMQEELKSYLENLKKSTAEREKIESEIAVARELQQGLLPRHFPSIAGCDLYAHLEPARMIGGDLYDFFFPDQDHLCFAIGDVSGKGIPGSLFMAITRTLFRSHMMPEYPPDQVMSIVNKELCKENPNMMFVTFQIGILNLKSGILSFCNAGHTRPYILSGEGKSMKYSCKPGLPMGIDDAFIYSTEKILMHNNDVLVIYTDGVTEASNMEEKEYCDERLVKILEISYDLPAREISENIVKDIKGFAGDAEQSDDIALMIIRYTGNPGPGFSGSGTDRISIRNKVTELEGVAAFIERFSVERSFSSNTAMELNLVLEELITNIIFYAYKDDAEHEIFIDFMQSGNRIEVTVTDDGQPFNLLENQPTVDLPGPIESRKVGGLGIHFVRKMTDSIEYSRMDNKNIIKLTKIIYK